MQKGSKVRLRLRRAKAGWRGVLGAGAGDTRPVSAAQCLRLTGEHRKAVSDGQHSSAIKPALSERALLGPSPLQNAHPERRQVGASFVQGGGKALKKDANGLNFVFDVAYC